MTKAYLHMAKEKFRLVAEHRNILGNERAVHGSENFLGNEPSAGS
jgi:hypothetical protein